MNRYPLWKYILIAVALVLGALYTAPNYFGESPALQVTTGKATVKVTSATTTQVEDALKQEGIAPDRVSLDGQGNSTSVRVRFPTTDAQFKAKLALERDLNRDPADPDYIVTVNLVKNTPHWMQAIRALPMNLGLDLRGGVHFLMQVDAKAVLENKVKGIQSSARSMLRDKNVRHAGIERVGNAVEIKFRDAETRVTRARRAGQPAGRPGVCRRRRRRRPETGRHAQAGRAQAHRRRRRQAEHRHAVEADQRTGRDRADHPAAGRRPHRDPAAGRAGRGARERHHRPHRDPGNAHGRRFDHAGHRNLGRHSAQFGTVHRRHRARRWCCTRTSS